MDFFKNIFKHNKLSRAVDLSVLKTDIHSHLIPAIDDGVQSIEESIGLITKMRDFGYTKLFTTPHIMVDKFGNTKEGIEKAYEKFLPALKSNNLPIDLQIGAEYMLDDGFDDLLKKNELLSMSKKNYVLVEMRTFEAYPSLHQVIFDLQVSGYNVILAHVERYTFWYDNPAFLQDLKDRGVLFQLNIGSLSGFYDMQVRKIAEKYIDKKWIDFLGTDMHNMNYYESVERALNKPYLQKALDTNPIKNHLL